jgi:hypothetical protein
MREFNLIVLEQNWDDFLMIINCEKNNQFKEYFGDIWLLMMDWKELRAESPEKVWQGSEILWKCVESKEILFCRWIFRKIAKSNTRFEHVRKGNLSLNCNNNAEVIAWWATVNIQKVLPNRNLRRIQKPQPIQTLGGIGIALKGSEIPCFPVITDQQVPRRNGCTEMPETSSVGVQQKGDF